MARGHKPSKMVHMPSDELFQQISYKCNYISPLVVKEMFYSMVKVIVKELREKGVCRLPDFGDFVITVRKERYMVNTSRGWAGRIPMKKEIQFMVDYKLKKYFNM